MNQLEKAGIVGPPNGGKPRKILKRDNENKKSQLSFKGLIDFFRWIIERIGCKSFINRSK